jgi:hypothetical protein
VFISLFTGILPSLDIGHEDAGIIWNVEAMSKNLKNFKVAHRVTQVFNVANDVRNFLTDLNYSSLPQSISYTEVK